MDVLLSTTKVVVVETCDIELEVVVLLITVGCSVVLVGASVVEVVMGASLVLVLSTIAELVLDAPSAAGAFPQTPCTPSSCRKAFSTLWPGLISTPAHAAWTLGVMPFKPAIHAALQSSAVDQSEAEHPAMVAL